MQARDQCGQPHPFCGRVTGVSLSWLQHAMECGPGSDGAISELQRLQNQQVARFADNVRRRREREPSNNLLVKRQDGMSSTDTDNLGLKVG